MSTHAPAPRPEPPALSGDAARIAAAWRGWSIEATAPTAADVAALAAVAPPGTEVFLSAVPGRPAQPAIAQAAALRAAGFEPVPHIAARNHADPAALAAFLRALVGDAGVRSVLVIAGDRDRPAGTLASALDVVASDLLPRAGICRVAVAGYPEGHPRIAADALHRAMRDKLDAARRGGLEARIVTQFSFDAGHILAWLRRLRADGITAPIQIGLAGPAGVTTLIGFARRCGVAASLRGLVRNAASFTRLVGEAGPGEIIRALAAAEARESLGDVALHLFSFGGVDKTARFAVDAAAGRLPD